MTPTAEILDSTWAGTRIGDMTRDELILAFWQAAELLQSSMDSHRSRRWTHGRWRRIADNY